VPYPHISLKSQIVDGLELDQLAVAELELAAFESGNTWDTSNVFIVEVSSSVIHTRRVMTVLTCLCDKVWITITASLVGASPVARQHLTPASVSDQHVTVRGLGPLNHDWCEQEHMLMTHLEGARRTCGETHFP
jgi:hypothetical protein